MSGSLSFFIKETSPRPQQSRVLGRVGVYMLA